jgi:hypothetical protein
LHQLIHEAQIYFVFLCDGKNAFGNVGRLCKLFDKALVFSVGLRGFGNPDKSGQVVLANALALIFLFFGFIF